MGSSSVTESSTKVSGLPHVTTAARWKACNVLSAFASFCGTGFASALQQLRTNVRDRF